MSRFLRLVRSYFKINYATKIIRHYYYYFYSRQCSRNIFPFLDIAFSPKSENTVIFRRGYSFISLYMLALQIILNIPAVVPGVVRYALSSKLDCIAVIKAT